MAAKVNTKFVAILAGTLILVFAGTTGTWLWLKSRSGDDNERRGDKLMAAGDYTGAEAAYAKAVNKQRTNIQRLEKWLDSLAHLTPDTQTAYEQKYYREYTGAIRELARAKRTDVAAWREWLELFNERVASQRFDPQNYLGVATEVDEVMKDIGADQPGPEQVLRRYSGLALMRVAASGAVMTEAQLKRAAEDLDAALAVDPADVEVALARPSLLAAESFRAARARQPEQAKALRERANEGMAKVIAQYPDDTRVVLAGIRNRVDLAMQSAGLDEDLSADERRVRGIAAQEKIKALLPELDVVAEKLSAAKDLTADIVGEFAALEGGMDPGAGWSRTMKVAQAQLARQPEDARTRSYLANTLGQTARPVEAIAEFQKIMDLPLKPLSTEGLRLFNLQNSAAVSRADLALQSWFAEEDPEKKKAAMAVVMSYRAELDKRGIKPEVPTVRLVDAKIKVAEEDWGAANKLLIGFFDSIGTDRHADALLIHAQVFMQLNQPGAAKTAIEKLLSMQPTNVTALKIKARAMAMLDDDAAALQLARDILAATPDDPESKFLVSQLEQKIDPSKIEDPVARDLAQMAAAGAAARDPIAQLRALAEKHKYDPRITSQLAQLLMEKQDKAGALAVVKQSLVLHPDDAGLKRLDTAISAEDTAAALASLIDDSELDPAEKALRKYSILRSYGRLDDASRLLKAEYPKFPKDTRLLELSFLEAIERRDVDAANALADAATRIDADGAEGLTFRARIFIMQDRMSDAAATLQQAVSRRAVTPEAWRLLARVYKNLGREPDAAKAYEEALKLRPNDRPILVEYITWVSGFDPTRALQLATANEAYATDDPEFQELLLRLNGRVGDKAKAIEGRLKIVQNDPENVNNLGALATLYLDIKKYDDAKPLIDKVKAVNDSVPAAILESRWHADQNKIDLAKKVMEDYLARQDQSKLTIDPFLAFGNFLVQRGQVDEGLDMMNRGRPFQDTKRSEIDRTLGDTLSGLGRTEAAVAAYERVLAAGGEDPKNLVHLRLAEMYLRIGKFKESDDILTKINASSDKESATAILLASDGAKGVGDVKRARDLLDRAVTMFPDDPLVYVKRAEFLMNSPADLPDAMRDLEAALRIRPGHARALQTRSQIHLANGDQEKADADRRTLVRANPQLEDMRDALISDLLKRGRIELALQVIDDAIASRPGQLNVINRMSDLLRVAERFADATRYSAMAWEISKEYEVGVRYLEALLNDPAGNLTRVEDILRVYQAEITQRPALLLSRAKLFAKRRPAEVPASRPIREDLIAAINLIPPQNLGQLLAWRKDIRRIYTNPADLAAFYTDAAKISPMRDWILYFLNDMLVTTDRSRDQGVKGLAALAQGASDDNVRVLSHRLIGSSWLSVADYQKATDAWLEGLKAFPEDWEMNNNVAYVLCVKLGKPEAALAHAEMAVKGSPTSPDALDTLGSVYQALKRFDEAEPMYKAAILRGMGTFSRVPPMIHLAQLELARGNKDAAAKIAQDLDAVLATIGKDEAIEYRTEIIDLKQKIDAK